MSLSIVLEAKKYENNKIKIDYRFKIIYAIGIISVINSHLFGKASIELNIDGWFPYRSFHMPLFMFASGYFFKTKNVFHIYEYLRKKFKRLIIPIYSYNLLYNIFSPYSKNFVFINRIKQPFNFQHIILEPLGGSENFFIIPSWFCSSLFFVESINIIKRRILKIIKIDVNESIYFIIDLFISSICVNLSNKGYRKFCLYKHILRFMHLNIYYEFGIFFSKHLEVFYKNIKNEYTFFSIFILKLSFHLYYSKMPEFEYINSDYYNYSPFTVIINSILGILFWMKISEIVTPLIGRNFYINIIADNTYSIMMNHFFVIFIIKNIFAIIYKKTKFCKDFNFKKHYTNFYYIYVPNNIVSVGIIYFLNCLIFPIIIQKFINKIKINIKRYVHYIIR